MKKLLLIPLVIYFVFFTYYRAVSGAYILYYNAETDPRPALLAKIAECESEGEHFTSSGEVIRGTVTPEDVGKWQINEYFHAKTAKAMGLDLEKELDNEKFAYYLLGTQGVQAWEASFDAESGECWRDLKD